MEDLKTDIEQIKVQLFTGIKLGRVEKEWGNMIIETCNRALTITSVVGRSEQCKHDKEPITDKEGFEVCPCCGEWGENC